MNYNRPLAPALPGSHDPHAYESKRRKNVSSACQACKARKLKCSGVPPCKTCLKSKVECVIDTEGDQRRKLNLKKKIDSLEDDRRLLLQLMETLQRGPQSYNTELVHDIRTLENINDVKLYLKAHLMRKEAQWSPEWIEVENDMKWISEQQPQEKLSTQKRTPILPVPGLVDIPSFRVPASPWTSVTEDDSFISHLISLWFTCSFPGYNYIDQELFLRAMRSRDLRSPLCSPFLVNAMLADACFLSDHPKVCAIAGDSVTKGEHFWKEAKRLLDEEEGRVSIPTTQGLGIMFTCACAMGKDRAGWVYTIQAAEVMKSLRKAESRVVNTGLSASELRQLLDRIELGQFNTFVSANLTFQIPPSIRIMHIDGHVSMHANIHHNELPFYAHFGVLSPIHHDCILNELGRISNIAWDAAAFLFGETSYTHAELVAAVQRWHSRLVQWWNGCRKCMDYRITPIPSLLSLHMYYHSIIITIYAFLKTAPPDADSHMLGWAEQSRQMCLSSAHAINQLIEIQQSSSRSDPGPVVNAQWITIALCILMEDLQNPDNHKAFMNLCKAHGYFAQRLPLAKGMVRMVQLTAQRMDRPLPGDVVAYFREFEERCWRAGDSRTRAFSSRYPNFAVAIRRGINNCVPEDVELDVFLERWVSLDNA
ncbi:hypothetical protein BGW36DRAFT_305078 [Talaromyces proteolyticus]|uniref:Zn(2)-C6 fungal-type domain-containing protein n=1 Tax=Talaromyces proteolyticus TaxID=1131652 RepID=A0AAD4KI39_9EURO|nr:uncharacterized protein BGW36DRAFT_305078 [Talaromyces proteolyticus]KAH8691609.1 hypothetical protein BGW36DRAFT_305078 [Talaromyces proteolyticus]